MLDEAGCSDTDEDEEEEGEETEADRLFIAPEGEVSSESSSGTDTSSGSIFDDSSSSDDSGNEAMAEKRKQQNNKKKRGKLRAQRKQAAEQNRRPGRAVDSSGSSGEFKNHKWSEHAQLSKFKDGFMQDPLWSQPETKVGKFTNTDELWKGKQVPGHKDYALTYVSVTITKNGTHIHGSWFKSSEDYMHSFCETGVAHGFLCLLAFAHVNALVS